MADTVMGMNMQEISAFAEAMLTPSDRGKLMAEVGARVAQAQSASDSAPEYPACGDRRLPYGRGAGASLTM
jgi:hypothetical protein